jgi:Holliday junction DNA helicase RuvA
MYDHITGTLVSKAPMSIVLETGGVGYRIHVPLSTYERLQRARTDSVKIYTHLHVREDQLRLFGFATEEERELFRLLQGVSGVGPNTALGILSSSSVDDIKQSIAEENVAMLRRIKGIGRKTAERIVVELREKISKEMPVGVPGEAGSRGQDAEYAVQALISLGYTVAIARKAVRKALKKLGMDATVEKLIKEGLRHTS